MKANPDKFQAICAGKKCGYFKSNKEKWLSIILLLQILVAAFYNLAFLKLHKYKQIEKVQERALRFINNYLKSSLSELPQQTNTQPLHVRRMKLMEYHRKCIK